MIYGRPFFFYQGKTAPPKGFSPMEPPSPPPVFFSTTNYDKYLVEDKRFLPPLNHGSPILSPLLTLTVFLTTKLLFPRMKHCDETFAHPVGSLLCPAAQLMVYFFFSFPVVVLAFDPTPKPSFGKS